MALVQGAHGGDHAHRPPGQADGVEGPRRIVDVSKTARRGPARVDGCRSGQARCSTVLMPPAPTRGPAMEPAVLDGPAVRTGRDRGQPVAGPATAAGPGRPWRRRRPARCGARPWPQRRPVTLHRVPVTPCGRSGEGLTRPQGQGVVGGGPHQAGEGVEGQPGRRRHPLHLPDEGHHMVGGDGCGGMVRGAVGVLDGHRPAPQSLGHRPGDRVAGHREGDPRPQSLGADGRGGQGNQRMERTPAWVGSEDLQPQRSGEVDDRGGRRPERPGRPPVPPGRPGWR